ncbi:hypothetical protein BCD96_000461 [Clostridium beijerinckii]|nr:hypothetical protein [Clostridium beijerinckii]NRU41157.1 hypothetical protein [Clostridium beijerinckii]NSA95568.1 hypothetical protein [Clostridium beijerinckii]
MSTDFITITNKENALSAYAKDYKIKITNS